MIVIREPTDDLVSVHVDDGTSIDLVRDDKADEWLVASATADGPQHQRFPDREQAMQYALELVGVIEDGQYGPL